MASIHQQITEKFLAALLAKGDVDQDKVHDLRQLLSRGKKPKADDFVKVFAAPKGGEVK